MMAKSIDDIQNKFDDLCQQWANAMIAGDDEEMERIDAAIAPHARMLRGENLQDREWVEVENIVSD